MHRTAFRCDRCDQHVYWTEGVNDVEVKRFIAEHEEHGCLVGSETDSEGVFEFTHQVGLPS